MADSGPGFPGPSHDPAAGRGLGLRIVRAVAPAHGGSVHINASPTGGVAVQLHVPNDSPSPRRDRATARFGQLSLWLHPSGHVVRSRPATSQCPETITREISRDERRMDRGAGLKSSEALTAGHAVS